MKRSLRLLPLALLPFAPACALAVTPLTGLVYSDVKYPVAATSEASGTKTGAASASSYLGLCAVGDASVEAACANGRITKIHSVSAHGWSILGIYAKFTTTVNGN
ncbi:MAG TPA: TRL-like family protein [Planctomycetota bacterium]|jgi:hypothetical protein|nr:TRL-like family protein [Planctomycetota bacterium]